MTPTKTNPPPLPFQSHQLAFTQWIRHPDQAVLPQGISAKRMNTYRDLVFNNIASFVEHTYPVTQALLTHELWHHLIDAFFQYGQCGSPYYYDISLHFKDFLDQPIFNGESPQSESSEDSSPLNALKSIHSDYPWLRELMQFEWMALYVEMAEVEWLDDCTDLQLKTTCWILAYQYPVHTWSIQMTVDDIHVQPSCLLVYRDENFLTQVYPIHLFWAFIIDTLQTQESIQRNELEQQLLQATQRSTSEVQEVLNQLCTWLQTINLLQATPTQDN